MGITISKEQLAEATERVEAAGLQVRVVREAGYGADRPARVGHLCCAALASPRPQDRITFLFCDYRDTPAQLGADSFDAVVSCEAAGLLVQTCVQGAQLPLRDGETSIARHSDRNRLPAWRTQPYIKSSTLFMWSSRRCLWR